jgi:hypothetical protein
MMVTHHEWGESSNNKEEEYNERKMVEIPLNLVEIMRGLMEELQIFRAKND